jgi:hypothetical protein
MRSVLALLVVVALAGCDAQRSPNDSTTRTVDPNGAPKIEIVGGDSLDFGTASPGILQDTVRITNVGNDTLKIVEVRPSCGCTTAGIDNNILLPGDTARVPITLDVTHYTGYVRKNLTIMSNDSTRPNFQVALVANLVRDLMVNPTFFPVPEGAKAGVETSTQVAVMNLSQEPISIGPPRITDAAELIVRFDMTSPVVVQPGDSVPLVARVKPVKQGVAGADVIVPTNSKRQPTLSVRLTVSAQ